MTHNRDVARHDRAGDRRQRRMEVSTRASKQFSMIAPVGRIASVELAVALALMEDVNNEG
jgi:hypothetical protein